MRLFLFWTAMDLGRGVVAQLKANSHDVVYWVGLNNGYNNDFPEAIFHDHFDACDGKPAPALASIEFDPPSCDLIKRFHNAESVILTMMNKRFDWMGVDERKHLYYHLLSYWRGVMKKFRPEAVVFETVPHAPYEYLLYELARSENIKTILFRGTLPVAGRLLLCEDFRESSSALRSRLEENKTRRFLVSDLSGEWQEFYKNQTESGRDTTPTYLKENRKRHAFFSRIWLKINGVAAAFKRGEFFELALRRLMKSLKENIRGEYLRLESRPDFTQKFVYAPLHYQPESTSSPLGDIFVDQILMLKIVSASLPTDWYVYVKEHPAQWFKSGLNFSASRYRGYYEKIAGIKNVRLMPIVTDTHMLARRARATVTISGVPGSEALLRQKPVIVFGYPWYRDCPGVFGVDGVPTCREAFQKIEDGFSINPRQVLNFLKTVDDVAIRAYLDDYGRRMSGLSADVSVANISRAILEALEKR